ncbi:hypothetical protein HQ535_05510 [bacterium]|nr:hypothetical protein [bacterium]
MAALAFVLGSCSAAGPMPAAPDEPVPAENSLTGLVGESREIADAVDQRTAEIESMLP